MMYLCSPQFTKIVQFSFKSLSGDQTRIISVLLLLVVRKVFKFFRISMHFILNLNFIPADIMKC